MPSGTSTGSVTSLPPRYSLYPPFPFFTYSYYPSLFSFLFFFPFLSLFHTPCLPGPQILAFLGGFRKNFLEPSRVQVSPWDGCFNLTLFLCFFDMRTPCGHKYCLLSNSRQNFFEVQSAQGSQKLVISVIFKVSFS